MRITNSMLVRNMMTNLNKNLERMSKLQEQYQSGKLFQLPSDNPIGVSKSLKLYTDKSKIEQYKNNLEDAIAWLYTTEDALDQIGEVLKRASNLTVKAANGTNNDDDLLAIKEEMKELKNQIIQAANATHAGRHVFSGYKTDRPLLDENGNYYLKTDPNDTSVVKLGANEISVYNVGVSENIEVNTVGIKVFGVGDANYSANSVDSGEKAYVIQVFDDIIGALEASDFDKLSENIDVINGVLKNTLQVRAEIGAKTNRLQMTKNRLESDAINTTRLLSENEDADLAEVIMNIKVAESIYQASLSSGARIIQPSLVDFLR